MSGSSQKCKNLFLKPTQGNESNYNKTIFSESTLTNYKYSFLDGTNCYSSPYQPSSFSSNCDETITGNSFITQSLLSNTKLPSTLCDHKAESFASAASYNKKSGTKFCKDKQIYQTPHENIDFDLISLAKSIKPIENLNSDSSGDTVIEDFSNSKDSESPLLTEKGFPKVNCTSVASSSSLLNNHINTSITPILKEHYSKSLSKPAESIKNIKTSFATFANNHCSNRKTPQMTKKAPINAFMYDSQLPLSKNVSTDKSSNIDASSANVKRHFYASMGLDEDLCDVKTKSKEDLLPEPNLHNVTYTNTTPVGNFYNHPIKKEIDVSPIGFGEANQTTPNLHISMTFEADPYDIDDEDLPLSILKLKSSSDDTPEIKSQCQYLNNATSEQLLPTFIKKELIEEDQIVSVTDCNFPPVISGNKLPTVLNNSNSNAEQNVKFDLSIKVKTEPIDEFDYSGSLNTSNSAVTQELHSAHLNSDVSEKSKNPDTLKQNLPTANLNSEISEKSSTQIEGLHSTHLKSDILLENAKTPKKNIKNKKTTKNKKSVSKTDLHSKSITTDVCCSTESDNNLSVSFNLLESYKQKSDELIKNPDLKEACKTGSNSINVTETPKYINKATENDTLDLSFATTVIKKSIGRKTTKQKKYRAAPQFLNVESPDDSFSLKSQTSSISENCDTLFSDSSLSSARNEKMSKKKVKKKKRREDKLDENLPITLLIKRQQSDSSIHSSDSYLFTSIKKSISSESKVIDSNETVSDEHEKANSHTFESSNTNVPFHNSAISISEIVKTNSPSKSFLNITIKKTPEQKKNISKKKNSRKKGKAFSSRENLINEVSNVASTTNLEPKLHLIPPNHSSSDENLHSSKNLNKQNCNLPNSTNQKVSSSMDFDDDSSSGESSLPLKTLIAFTKKKKKFIKKPEDLFLESGVNRESSPNVSSDSKQTAPSSQKTSSSISSTLSLNIDDQQINDKSPESNKSEKSSTEMASSPDTNSAFNKKITKLFKNFESDSLTESETYVTQSPLNKTSGSKPSDQYTPCSPTFTAHSLNIGNQQKNYTSSEPHESAKNISVPKKKRRANNNWYKKKKAKKKKVSETNIFGTLSDKIITTAADYEKTEPESLTVSDIHSTLTESSDGTSKISENFIETSASKMDTNVDDVCKMSVVLVENLLETKEQVKDQEEETDEAATELEEESVTSKPEKIVPAKRKRKKKASTGRKRRKTSNVKKDKKCEDTEPSSNIGNLEIVDDTIKSYSTYNESSSNLFKHVETNKESLPLDDATSKNSVEETLVTEKDPDIVTIEDSPIKPHTNLSKHFIPLLSIDSLQKDLAGLESLKEQALKRMNINQVTSHLPLNQSIDTHFNSVTDVFETTDAEPANNLFKTSPESVSLNFVSAKKSQTKNLNAFEQSQLEDNSVFAAPLLEVKKEKNSESISQNNFGSKFYNSLDKNITQNIDAPGSNYTNSLTQITDQPPVNLNCNSEIHSHNGSRSALSLSKVTNKILGGTEQLNDSIGLDIKREAFNQSNSISCANKPIRNIDELVRTKQNTHYLADALQSAVNNNFIQSNSKTSNSSIMSPLEPSLSLNVSNMIDDEIEVIQPEPKSIPCVDISDDEVTDLEIKTNSNFQSMQDNFNKSDNSTSHSNSSYQTQENVQVLSDHPRNVESSEADIGAKTFSQNLNYDMLSDDSDDSTDIAKQAIDSLAVKEKYINEYFKSPFPPSVPFQNNQRSKNKIYSRIKSQALNLSIENVAMRLKNSYNSKYHFGNKLGDIVKLEKYPVSASEVECYHRILGVAPSHNLLSQCFKIPDKNSFEINEFKLYKELEESSNSSAHENKSSNMISSLNDIIKGMTENKTVVNNNSDIQDRNCPSADTRDSFESHFSNVSDTNFTQKEVSIFTNIQKENNHSSVYQESTSFQNTVLSTITSELQSTPEIAANVCITKDIGTINNDNIQNKQTADFQSILNHSVLPIKSSVKMSDSDSNNFISTKSTVESKIADNRDAIQSTGHINVNIEAVQIINSENFSSPSLISETVNNIHNSPLNDIVPLLPTNKSNDLSYEFAKNSCKNSDSLKDLNDHKTIQYSSENTYVDPKASSSLFQTTSNLILDLDVPDLRKILEVASTFPTNESNITNTNSTDIKNVWENKTTFEYNHTLSTPVSDANSKLDEVKPDDKIETSTGEIDMDISSDNVCNSDDDTVDNEPIHNTSDNEKNEQSDVQNDEEFVIPEYKSKWEKIMERKSLESKEKVNEHLLKDCFPVSSKVPNKKLNVSNKSVKEYSKTKVVKEHDGIKEKSVTSMKSKCEKKSHESKELKVVKNKTSSSKADKCKNVKDTKKSLSKGKKDIVEDYDLFTPDKPVTKSSEKSTNSFDKQKDSSSKKFYGNRVTNRGTFLTESSEYLKTLPKIPKKKNMLEPKKLTNVRSEEFHSIVKSPDILLETKMYRSKYKIVNKHNTSNNFQNKDQSTKEFCRNNPLSNQPKDNSFNQIPIHTTNPRDPRQAEQAPLHRNSVQTIIPIPRAPVINSNEFNKKALLPTPSLPFHKNGELLPTRNSPLLSTPSTSFPLNQNHYPSSVPLLNNPSSNYLKQPVENAPPMAFLQNFLRCIQQPNLSMITKESGILPLPKTLVSSANNTPPFSLGFEESTNSSIHSDVSSIHSDVRVFRTDLPVLNFNMQNSVQPNISLQSQIETSIIPQDLKSSTAQINQNPVLLQTNKKATSTCLVPQHLKKLVGNSVIETANVRLLMLEWSVDWLMQQQKNRNPPPISSSLKKVVSSYENFEDHYNTYFPLMMLDTWHRIYVSWTHLSQATPYFCDITSYSVKSNYVSVECQTIFNTSAHPKGVFPDEGSILMIKYGTKSNDFTIKILGYVTCVKTRYFNQVTDSRLCNFKPPQDGNYDVFQVLTLSYMGAYNSEDIDKRLPIRIHVLCNVKCTLKQNDALLYIKESPLLNTILNPVEDGVLRSVALTPRNSSQDKINECVRDITKGILSPHPLPLLTIVRAVPQSDRLNIIPLLITKMKTVYRTKVLLCVRTVKSLGDIAANICLHDSLKLVIVNKRCDTSPQFQKYLLDELVTAELSSTAEPVSEHLHSKNEAMAKTKKQILKDCDVVLSLIRNCHDEFMETTFRDTECVAQMCCIIDEANLCTEPETLIPILHGISKLILIGNPDYPAKVLSKTASSYDYNQSFFHRAHDLDLITE